MANLRLYMETIAGQSPTKFGVSERGAGRAIRNFIIGDDGTGVEDPITDRKELWDAIEELVGAVDVYAAGSDNPRLRRKLPMADPMFPWWYCESIGDITGIGQPSADASLPYKAGQTDIIDFNVLYPCYRISSATFSPRPYDICADDDIGTGQVQWTDQSGQGTIEVYAQEWLRFVEVEDLPQGEYIIANAGQFAFDAPGDPIDGQPAGSGQIRMYVKKRSIKMTWYKVPYTVVYGSEANTSWIFEGIGCINQHDWWKYPQGSLLLDGVIINKYDPFKPKVVLRAREYGASKDFASHEKQCDVTFIMSHQNPDRAVDPAAPDIVLGDQIVQRGHNLAPYAHTLSWYFIKTNIPGYTGSDARPIYPSFPFQLLFSNRDATA